MNAKHLMWNPAVDTKRSLMICLLVILCASLPANAMSKAMQSPPLEPSAASRQESHDPRAELLATGLAGASGSTIGPDGALYVVEGAAGRISRVNPKTGRITTFASGLPTAIIGLGGVIDVAFIGRTAYALVTLVGSDVGGSNVVGIYRVDGRSKFTVVADIGAFAVQNPPVTPFDVPTGVQYALEPYLGGFLVTDGHHNRLLWVGLNGVVTEAIGFDNIVPTGLTVAGNRVYMAQAGPVPHLPQDGQVVLLRPQPPTAVEVASGARLLVDVEVGPRGNLFALSQGVFQVGDPPGAPALPNTGALVKARWDGTFKVITRGLNQPTSLEFIEHIAYIVTLGGEVWTIDLRHRRH